MAGRCSICNRKSVRPGGLPTGIAYRDNGEALALSGDMCGVCLAGEGWMSEEAYGRVIEEGYEKAQSSYGEFYANYLRQSDKEHRAKGLVPKRWPLSLQGNDGD